jgi:rubredoxin
VRHSGDEQSAVSADTSEKSFPPVRFACPKCATAVVVVQSQGDLCPGCGFEFKWFLPHEEKPARDFHAAVTGETYFLPLPEGAGWIVAHS